MSLKGVCSACLDDAPNLSGHGSLERRDLRRGPEGDKLCPRHATEAWEGYDA